MTKRKEWLVMQIKISTDQPIADIQKQVTDELTKLELSHYIKRYSLDCETGLIVEAMKK